jgi:hypothetical protein
MNKEKKHYRVLSGQSPDLPPYIIQIFMQVNGIIF